MSPKTLTVIVAAFEAQEWIAKCLDSILDQDILPSYKLQLIVGIDGCEKTLAALSDRHRALAEVYMMEKNYGTYITFNTMAHFAKGDIICRFDADDYMYPNFLRTGMMTLLGQKVDHVRFLFDREWKDAVTDRENLEPSLGTIMFTRKMWAALGGYQPWRVSADCDFIRRAVIAKFKCAVPVQALFFYRYHAQSLTQALGSRWDSVERQKIKEVQTQSTRCYEKYGTQALKVVPLQGKAKKLASEDDLRPKSFDKFVTVSIASIPERVETLQKVVSSLLPQVDKLNVYLNNYTDVPLFLNQPNIEVARSQTHGDLGDNGKFWWAADVRGYHLTCDDDIGYPANYVEEMIAAIERYERRAIISCHGSIIPRDYDRTQTRKVFHFCKDTLTEDQPIHIPGTGVAGYHTDGCHLTIEHFPKFINADIFVGIYAQRSCTPVICMAHKKDWLTAWEYENSIWLHSLKKTGTTMDNGAAGTELILSLQPWKINEYKPLDKLVTIIPPLPTRGWIPPKVVSVLIAAYKAEQWIEGCVKNVLEQDLPEGWKVEVIIGVDGCDSTWDAVTRIKDPRVGNIFFSENNGTYITFNSIVPHSRGSLILRHDADDLMGEGRLLKMINCFIEDPTLAMVGTFQREMSADMNEILKSRMYPVEGCWMWSRSVWDTVLGGFEPWRCGADSELLVRARCGFKLPFFIIKDPSLYLYRQHPNSLSFHKQTAHGSPLRKKRQQLVGNAQVEYWRGKKPKKVSPKITKEKDFCGQLFNLHFEKRLNQMIAYPWRLIKSNQHVISVIIAAWQAEKWVEDSVRSVLTQDLPKGWKLEVIIGTDGCSRTKKVCQDLPSDDRIGFVYFPENRGTYAVFNDLLSLSQGELIARHDADDLMLPNRLFAIIETFEKNPDVELVNTWWIDGSEHDEHHITRTTAQKGGSSVVIEKGYSADKQWIPVWRAPPQPPAMGIWTWRREALEKVGSFETWCVAADAEILMQADLASLKKIILPSPLYYRRRHSNSLVHLHTKTLNLELNEVNKRKNENIRRPAFIPKPVVGDFAGRLWKDALIISSIF